MPKNGNDLTITDIVFLNELHNTQLHIDKMLETRVQILLVTASLILTFALTRVIGISFSSYTLWEYAWMTISCASLLAISIAFFTIKPRVFFKTKDINFFYYGDFIRKISEKDYSSELTKKLGNKKEVVNLFTRDLYNLAKNVFIPDFRKIRLAYNIFIIGIILGFLILIMASLS